MPCHKLFDTTNACHTMRTMNRNTHLLKEITRNRDTVIGNYQITRIFAKNNILKVIT
ncbi:hypothetical protein HMPREF9446_01706 [Bacteroides fluxus YIT 12057]|uniref:Uncharacterized protein n=1 Tax=Bacteroides fluxus YIT 12057 TaxID=763034 RepID=F3PSH3_9BACE|nr:hypothetical protein HMPREF9446_01706 [Bacteroides fluxus YIT 12057]